MFFSAGATQARWGYGLGTELRTSDGGTVAGHDGSAEGMIRRNIALVGESGSGKTTAARFLALKYGLIHCSIAAPTKRAVGGLLASWTGNDGDHLALVEEHKDACRVALQALGDTLLATARPTAIVDALIACQRKDGLPVVVDDCRMPWEAEAFRAAGWRVVRLDRPGAGLRGEQGHHHTESLIISCEYDSYILNNGSLLDLFTAVDNIAHSYGWQWKTRPAPGLAAPEALSPYLRVAAW